MYSVKRLRSYLGNLNLKNYKNLLDEVGVGPGGFRRIFLFKLINMKIVRTDGGGESFTDERLKIVRSTIFYYGLERKILKLNDHKGILNVFWEQTPTENDMSTIENIWESFNESLINHFFVNYSLIKEVSL